MGNVRAYVPSAAKAAVAQQKPRDDAGRFLSGEELQAYRQQAEQQQFEAERAKMGAILGKREQQQAMPIQPMGVPQQVQGIPQQNNFMDMINANKPGMRGQQDSEEDKWAMLLGKRKSGNGRW